jgi:Na+-driven multidrug efflux pump
MKLMVLIFLGMSYQMPTLFGIVRGGGDTRFNMINNLVFTWGVVMPLSFAAAFWWKLPVFWVVFFLNCDQLLKCVPAFLYANSYRWVHVLTRETEETS